MKRVIIFLIVFLLSINIFCQEDILFSNNGYINFQNQDYYLLIILVNDLKETMDIWSIPNVTPRINQTTTVKTNESIALFIVYATSRDRINLTYNLRMREPDGTFSENINYNGLKISDTVINKQVLYTAAQLPEVAFDEEDEIGKYYFVIEVYDNNELIKIFILEFNLLE